MGRYIVEFERSGNEKEIHGKNLLPTLSKELTLRLGKGYSRPNLNNMRKFYLNWSHICELIKIGDDLERSFYEKQCVKERWGIRTLKRQLDSALFFGFAASRDKEGILELANKGVEISKPEDVIKDTYTLEF
ncbi:MAG: DUF1016 N-terminal domain-containing protein [Lachnospiraceae bacterium]|nr:DUF1016 N-terminal domain-containing protein [Lachnospiraceae bacterium]